MRGMDKELPPDRRIAVLYLYHLRRARHWLILVLGGVALALLPWTGYLSATLPGEHVAHHWDVAWAGFDLFEALALVLTLFALVRGSPRLPLFAAVAGTALATDAWFDLSTAHPGSEFTWALVEAFLAELPLAALCFWIAFDATEALVSAATAPVLAAAPRPTSPPTRPAQGREPARTGGSEAPSAERTSR
jgi:hypothetical protein